MTISELKARTVDQLRRVRLEEKRLRVAALGYDAGELDAADLLLTSLRYAAEVQVYRQLEGALIDLGVRVPREVREGMTTAEDWEPETVVDTTACVMRRGGTLQ